MTPAQREALEILAEQEKPIDAWKRSSTREPIPRINMVAAGSLVKRGLAKTDGMPPSWRWSPYTHDFRYEITEAGRQALA